MPKKPSNKTKAKTPATTGNTAQSSRFWLMYPPKLIKTPIIWQLTKKFPLVTNVRQASVTDEIGVVCLELDGDRAVIKAAITWMEKQGIRVEPVEINILES